MYRLVEYYRVGAPITYPVRYSHVDAAVERAELILRELAGKPRCPWQILIVDPTSGEIVHRVRPYLDTEYDPDPFAPRHTGDGDPPTLPESPGDTPPGATDPSQMENGAPGGPTALLRSSDHVIGWRTS